jgi:hypothetical protein
MLTISGEGESVLCRTLRLILNMMAIQALK